MNVIKELKDWYKASIIGDQSKKDEKSKKEFENHVKEAAHHVILSDRVGEDGLPYPVICINGTVVYKITPTPCIEKGEISLESVGEVLTRQRIYYAENSLNYR